MSKGIYWKCLRCDFGHIEDECPNCGWHTRGEFDLPPQRTWVGLTDEEKNSVWDRAEKRQAYQGVPALMALIQEVEAKLKENNT